MISVERAARAEALAELISRLEEPVWECEAGGKIVPIVDMWRADMRQAAAGLLAMIGEIERLRGAMTEGAEKYDAEARDLRHDDATRRGYMFAARLARSALATEPVKEG